MTPVITRKRSEQLVTSAVYVRKDDWTEVRLFRFAFDTSEHLARFNELTATIRNMVELSDWRTVGRNRSDGGIRWISSASRRDDANRLAYRANLASVFLLWQLKFILLSVCSLLHDSLRIYRRTEHQVWSSQSTPAAGSHQWLTATSANASSHLSWPTPLQSSSFCGFGFVSQHHPNADLSATMAPMGIRLSPLGVAVFCLLGVGVIYHLYAGVISSRLAAFRWWWYEIWRHYLIVFTVIACAGAVLAL